MPEVNDGNGNDNGIGRKTRLNEISSVVVGTHKSSQKMNVWIFATTVVTKKKKTNKIIKLHSAKCRSLFLFPKKKSGSLC